MKKLFVGSVFALALAFGVSFAAPAHAATLTEDQISALISLLSSFGVDSGTISNVTAILHGETPSTAPSSCLTLSNNLYAGLTDNATEGEVSELQQFLGVSATGYFGPMTEEAVQQWQAAHDVVSSGSPDTTGYGFVGPLTRSALACSGGAQVGTPVQENTNTNSAPPQQNTTNTTQNTQTTPTAGNTTQSSNTTQSASDNSTVSTSPAQIAQNTNDTACPANVNVANAAAVTSSQNSVSSGGTQYWIKNGASVQAGAGSNTYYIDTGASFTNNGGGSNTVYVKNGGSFTSTGGGDIVVYAEPGAGVNAPGATIHQCASAIQFLTQPSASGTVSVSTADATIVSSSKTLTGGSAKFWITNSASVGTGGNGSNIYLIDPGASVSGGGGSNTAYVKSGGSFTGTGGSNIVYAEPGASVSSAGATIHWVTSIQFLTGSSATNEFTASQNAAFSGGSVASGVINTKVASFTLGASSAESIHLSSVQLKTSASSDSAAGPLRLQNLRAQIGSTVLNYNIPSMTANSVYSFSVPSGNVFIPAGGSIVVDAYADVLQGSTSGTYASPVSLAGAVGTGASSATALVLETQDGAAVSNSVPFAGQNLTVSSATGTGSAANESVTVSGVPNDPVAQTVAKGATGIILGKFQLRANGNEAVSVSGLKITAFAANASASASPFQNAVLVDASGNPVAGAGPVSFNLTSSGVFTATFSPTNMTVPQNGTLVFGLRGDVSADENFFRSNDGSSWTFSIANNSDINAVGASSAGIVAITGAGSATQTQPTTAVAAKLALASFAKVPGAVINNGTDLALGQATFTATGSAGTYALLKTLTVTVSGPAVSTASAITSTLTLRNPGDIVVATANVTLSSASPSASATFVIPTSTTDGRVFVGSDKTFTVSMDTSRFVTPSASNPNPSVQLQIGAGGTLSDVGYATYLASPSFAETFALDNSAPSAPLPKTVTVSY